MKLSKKEITEKYETATNELAITLSKIHELRNTFKQLFKFHLRHGEAYFPLDEAIVKLSASLAAANIYTREYKEELNKAALP